VLDTLLERGFHVFALNPKQLDRFRDGYTVAGAKDDRRDAFVLATALATDQPAFRALAPEDPLIIELREWSRWRMSCVRSGGASPVGCAGSSTGFIRRRSPSVPPPTKGGFGRSWGSLPRPPRPSGSGAPPW